MESSSRAWCAVAAYLYVLHLDSLSLAWEYLRRNPLYLADCRSHAHDDPSFTNRWGIVFPENPSCDAFTVQPVWYPDPDTLVRIWADESDASLAAKPFSLWAIPGRKSLLHDGRRLLLTAVLGTRVLRLSIAGSVSNGRSFAFVIPSGPRAKVSWQEVQNYLAVLRTADPGTVYVRASPPGRLGSLHMRALQALDGRTAGASQRDIAAAIFGEARVREHWHADSQLRAQVRHLLRRGEALMRGEYRALITASAACAYGDERR